MAQQTQEQETVLEQGHEATTADVAGKRCPDCETVGAFSVRPIETMLSVGNDVAIVTINAIVCGVCGYRELDGINSTKLDEVRHRLDVGDTHGMEPVGTTYRVRP